MDNLIRLDNDQLCQWVAIGIGTKWRDAYVDVAFDNPKRKTAAATATSIRLKGRSL